MPVISLCTGGMDFKNWFISLDGKHYASLELAQKAKASTLNYGIFLTQVINFIIMAFVIFLMVKGMNTLARRVKRKDAEVSIETQTCPYCKSKIDIEATRCPQCTSQL